MPRKPTRTERNHAVEDREGELTAREGASLPTPSGPAKNTSQIGRPVPVGEDPAPPKVNETILADALEPFLAAPTTEEPDPEQENLEANYKTDEGALKPIDVHRTGAIDEPGANDGEPYDPPKVEDPADAGDEVKKPAKKAAKATKKAASK